MTKAEEMRMLTERAKLVKGAEIAKKHKEYVHKLIRDKVRVAANKGKKSAVIKLNRHYSISTIIDLFTQEHFKVERKSKNGKQTIVVNW